MPIGGSSRLFTDASLETQEVVVENRIRDRDATTSFVNALPDGTATPLNPTGLTVSYLDATANVLRILRGIGNALNVNVVAAPGGAIPNRTDATIRQVRVPVPGVAQQLPDITTIAPGTLIPDGFALVIRAIFNNVNFVRIGRTAADAQDATGDAPGAAGTPNNIKLAPGELARFFVQNSNIFFVDAVSANDGVEIFVER